VNVQTCHSVNSSIDGLYGEDRKTLDLGRLLDITRHDNNNQPRKSWRQPVASMPRFVEMDVAGFRIGNTPLERRGEKLIMKFSMRIVRIALKSFMEK